MRRFATSLLDADPPPRQGFPDMPRASGLAPAVRRTVAPAIWALSAYRGTALLLATTAAVGLAAVLPVTSLATRGAGGLATRLDLAPLGDGDLGMSWSALASNPTATRHAALLILVRLLLGVAAGVLAVAGLTVVFLSAARATARAPDVRVRRAVGASRRQVLGATLLESAAITAAALVPGALAGVAAGRLATAAWPGTADAGTTGLDVVAAAALVAGIVLGGAAPRTHGEAACAGRAGAAARLEPDCVGRSGVARARGRPADRARRHDGRRGRGIQRHGPGVTAGLAVGAIRVPAAPPRQRAPVRGGEPDESGNARRTRHGRCRHQRLRCVQGRRRVCHVADAVRGALSGQRGHLPHFGNEGCRRSRHHGR